MLPKLKDRLLWHYLVDDKEGSSSNVKGFVLVLAYGSQSCSPTMPFWLTVIMCSGMPEWINDLVYTWDTATNTSGSVSSDTFRENRSGDCTSPVHSTQINLWTQQSPAILDCRWGKSYDYRVFIVFKKLFAKCFPTTRKRKASVFKLLRFEEHFRKAPLSWLISVDGRPNRRSKAAFSHCSGVMCLTK